MRVGVSVEYYRSGVISVDQDFARFGSKSYAINKINTVDVRGRKPYGGGLLVVGVILVLIGLLVIVTNFGLGFGLFLIGAVVAYFGWKRYQVVVYDLYLKTSSSDVQAYESPDEDEIIKLRQAVEQAMMGR